MATKKRRKTFGLRVGQERTETMCRNGGEGPYEARFGVKKYVHVFGLNLLNEKKSDLKTERSE